MWNIDEIDYSDSLEAHKMRQLMFSALPSRHRPSLSQDFNVDVPNVDATKAAR